jgi:hypothetical protein
LKRLELIVRLGRVVGVLIPNELNREQLSAAYALCPRGRHRFDLARQWGVWGAIYDPRWRPSQRRPNRLQTLAFER